MSLSEVNPGDWPDDWWADAVEYWESESHKHRSVVASGNRSKLKNLHSGGARAFCEHEDVNTCLVHLGTLFCIVCAIFGFLIVFLFYRITWRKGERNQTRTFGTKRCTPNTLMVFLLTSCRRKLSISHRKAKRLRYFPTIYSISWFCFRFYPSLSFMLFFAYFFVGSIC